MLAPLVAAENAAAVWEDLDLSRKRAVIKTLMDITLLSPGKGARRAFDPSRSKSPGHGPSHLAAAGLRLPRPWPRCASPRTVARFIPLRKLRFRAAAAVHVRAVSSYTRRKPLRVDSTGTVCLPVLSRGARETFGGMRGCESA